MTRPFALCLMAAALLGLAACAAPTPYQPAVSRYGYADQQIAADRFRVSFAGNLLTPRETVEDFLLYRAAELTLNSGNDYFILADYDTERFTSYRTTASSFGGFSGFYGSPFRHRGYFYGGSAFPTAVSRPQDRYTAYANIIVRRGPTPANDPEAYDARQVIQQLHPFIAGAARS